MTSPASSSSPTPSPTTLVRKLEPGDIRLVSSWLGDEENFRWLDFGQGVQALNAVSLKLMASRDIHALRVFATAESAAPIGVVALSDICPVFRTATLWYVLGDKAHGGGGHTSRAVSAMLSEGFGDLRLEVINAWAVAENAPSIRVLEKNHFRLIGRQRSRHVIGGARHDRLLFDLLASEHRPLEEAR